MSGKAIDIVKPTPTTVYEEHLRWVNRLASKGVSLRKSKKINVIKVESA
jgi:hypothetical protein